MPKSIFQVQKLAHLPEFEKVAVTPEGFSLFRDKKVQNSENYNISNRIKIYDQRK